MLHPVAREDDAAPVVELDGAADDEGALRIAEPLGDAGVDVRVGHRLVVLGDRGPVERRVPLEGLVQIGLVRARHRARSLQRP